MSSYAINPTDLHGTIEHLLRRGIAFRYEPEGRFKILLPDLDDAVATEITAVISEPLEWVFITEHCGVFTKPEMEAKWAADRKRSDERSEYWRNWANSHQ